MSSQQECSREAREANGPRAPTQRRMISAMIASAPEGHTCDELEVLLQLPHQTASARIRELAASAEIHTQGKRKTRRGRNACVWFPLFRQIYLEEIT